MNILVTGAGGFVGKSLCPRLVQRGHNVSGLAHDITTPFPSPLRFDLVVHLAAHNVTHVGDKDSGLYARVNVQGTKNVLEAVDSGHFIFLSTAKVYKNEGLPLTEDSPVGPAVAYEASKLKAEEACRSFFKGKRLVILRPVNIMGEGQAPKALLPIFFQKARQHQPLEIMGSARTPVQFVHVDDVADAVEAVIDHQEVDGIFNIACDKIVTIEELARKVIALTRSSSPLNMPGGREDVPCSRVVCDKALRQLGWKAKTGLEEILQRYQENGA